MFYLGKIAAALFFPPGLLLILSLLGIILIINKKKVSGWLIIILSLAVTYALSTNAMASLLVKPLESKFPPIASSANGEAVIVLGGGYIDATPEADMQGSLSPISEERAVYGLVLARRYKLPLYFSGGHDYESAVQGSEGEAAKRLWLSLGVTDIPIGIEKESLDTKGNAAGIKKLVAAKKIILVTSAFHMPRSVLSFTKAGYEVVPAATDYKAKLSKLTWADFLPDADKLNLSKLALHEYVGLGYYLLTL